jgi:hypothetical protein
MANDPIQADDGGSTRVKLFLRGGGVGAMDALLEVDNLVAPGKPYDGKVGASRRINSNGGPYTTIRITYVDSEGKPFSLVQPFAEFLIFSGDQRVHGEVLTGADAGDVLLTVFAQDGEPIVDAKQSRKRRRYIISNAPPIDQVFISAVLGGPSVMVYQSPDGARPLVPVTAAAVNPMFYTTVVVT